MTAPPSDPAPAWTAVTEDLEPAVLAQALAALQENEVEARAAGTHIEVPAPLEADATAILAGVLADDTDAPPPEDEAALLARCTHRINDAGMSGFEAQSVVTHLRSIGISATTGDGGTIGGSDAAMVPEYHIFIDPADAERVEQVLGQIREVAAEQQPSLLPADPDQAAAGGDAAADGAVAAGEFSPVASIMFLAALALVAFVVMKSCS